MRIQTILVLVELDSGHVHQVLASREQKEICVSLLRSEEGQSVAFYVKNLVEVEADQYRKMFPNDVAAAVLRFRGANVDVDLPDTAAQDSASKSNNPAVSG